MIDGLLSGLLGGLFGPAVAQWLGRFKYWAIFLVAMLLTQLFAIGCMLKTLGLEGTIKEFAAGINLAFFYVPLGIGALAVFVALIGSLSAPKENDSNDKQS